MPDTATTTPDRHRYDPTTRTDPTPGDPTPGDPAHDDPTRSSTTPGATDDAQTGPRMTGPTETASTTATDDTTDTAQAVRPEQPSLGHPVSAPSRRRGRPGRRNPGTPATTDTTVTPDKTDVAGPVIGTSAESAHDRVWAALRRHPGTTAAALADTSGVARSTVVKLLGAWSEDGSATSAAGATARAGRRWTAAPSERPSHLRNQPRRGHPDRCPGHRHSRHPAPRPCLPERVADNRRPRRSRGCNRRARPRHPCAGTRNHSRHHEPLRDEAAGRGSVTGDGPGLPERAPGRTRPHRDRTRVGTFLGRDRQRAQTPRRRRLGRARQRPTPALSPRRTPRRGCWRLTAVPSAGGPLPDAPCGARPAPRRAARASRIGYTPRRHIHPLRTENRL